MDKRNITVLDWLEKQERKNGEKLAVRDVNKQVSYMELAHKARVLASALTVDPRNAILLYMDKTVDCFAAMLGVLYAGCFYSVLDTQLPEIRLNYICDAAKAKTVITDVVNDGKARELFKDKDINIICFDGLTDIVDYDLLVARRNGICDSDPMYCNFTSGSTGNPKGVLISHRSVMDFIPEFCCTMDFTSDERFANQAPFDFDVSVKDMYSSLYLGSEVSLIPRDYFLKPTVLMDYLTEHKITTLVWAVSAMVFVSGTRAFRYKIPTHISKVIFSGEVMPKKHLAVWKENLFDATFVNVYGPTEITCNCTYYILNEEDFESDDIPIGIPFSNERVFLLNENDKEIKESGISGEICVAGTCLALGYIGAEKKKSFVINPLNDVYEEIIYRTGDKGRYDEKGLLHYNGRLDFQIKHMGHRIELAEIEKHCDSLTGVNRSGCIYDDDKKKIILFYDGDAKESEVASGLMEILPNYMRPSVIHHIDVMPISNHGKLDRNRLKEI